MSSNYINKSTKIKENIKNGDFLNSINYTNTDANTNTNNNSFIIGINNNNEPKTILANYNINKSFDNYIEDEKNNSNNNSNDNPINIDEIIKNKMSSAVVDSFLNQHQIKSIPMFILYLSEIWKELSKDTNSLQGKNLGINLYAFNKYYNLPGLIGQRLFTIFDIDNNGFLSPKEFISGMCTLFCEEINSLIKFIFNFCDFDRDDFITFDDIHAILSYLPIINGFDDMIDIEEEIYSTIEDIFINKKEKIDYNTFYDLIIRKERYELFIPLISFFYDNKPFNNDEINEFYNGYYNNGKFNLNENNYEIVNVINLKEIDIKDENKIEDIYAYSNSNKNIIDKKPILNFGEKKEQKLSNEEYEKFVLNSRGFEQMRKSIPLVIGNSNILQLKKEKQNNLKKHKYFVNLKETKKWFENINHKNNKKKREGSVIYSFCQNIIKGACSTFNNKMDNDSIKSEENSIQLSASFKLGSCFDNLGGIPWKNKMINNRGIKCESYLYKITKNGKLKKLYFKLNNQDLFFYKNENSIQHKGMHNLSTYFLDIKSSYINNINNSNNNEINMIKKENLKDSAYKRIINGIDYYIFLLINIKGQIHYYYTPDSNIYQKWINALKIILKYKNIYETYIFGEIIGKGKNCVVYCAYDKINKRYVAIKRINKSLLSLEDLSLIQTEIDTIKVCQHPYVVKLYEIIETYNEFNIVLEYCELGNLYSYLKNSKNQLSENQIAKYIHDISKAVYSMHNLGIIHRDLKLSNIALTKNNNEIEIRIIDFGLSKIIGPNQYCNEGYGTPGYAAPEVINRYNYSFEADIWSIGAITYFLCAGKLPFDYIRPNCTEKDIIENTLLDEVKFGDIFIKKYSRYVVKFIKDLMNKNTYERPNIKEVLEHEWLQLYFKNEVKKRKINTHKYEFYENPNISDSNTFDENIDKENSKEIRTNFLLYTSINNK